MSTPEQEVQDAISAIEVQEPPVNNELPMKRLTKMPGAPPPVQDKQPEQQWVDISHNAPTSSAEWASILDVQLHFTW